MLAAGSPRYDTAFLAFEIGTSGQSCGQASLIIDRRFVLPHIAHAPLSLSTLQRELPVWPSGSGVPSIVTPVGKRP